MAAEVNLKYAPIFEANSCPSLGETCSSKYLSFLFPATPNTLLYINIFK